MVTRFAPFKEPEFEYMESYLEDLAAQGLMLDHFGLLCAYFSEGEPCRRRYRIVPRIQRAVNEDEILLYENAGWFYVGKKYGTGLNIFYTDDADAPEIFTDMYSFRMYARKYALVGCISIICMLWLLYNAFDSADLIFINGIIHAIDEMGVLISVAFALVLMLMVAVVEAFVLSEFSTMYRILAAKPIRHNIEYKGKLKFHIVTFIATVILAAILIIGSYFIGYEKADRDAMMSYDGNHPASYEIVDPDGWAEIQHVVEIWEWPENIHFDVFTKTGILFDEKSEVFTEIGDNYMRAVYRVAKSEWIAEKWLEEEILYNTDYKRSPEEVALKTPAGLDYLGYTEDKWSGQEIYMRKGNMLEHIYYLGDKDIRDYIDEFVIDIAE